MREIRSACSYSTVTFLKRNKLLNGSQFEYRTSRKNGDEGILNGALSFDSSKAFDTIEHDIIIK